MQKVSAAHEAPDTLIPQALWDAAQADLGQLDSLVTQLAAEYGVTVRTYRAPKHPFPCRELVKRRSNETRFAGIVLDPSSSTSERQYSAGVSVAPRGLFALWRRGHWTRLAQVRARDVAVGNEKVLALVRESAERAFGPSNTPSN